MICSLLSFDTANISYTEDYITDITSEDIDLRQDLSPKKDFKTFDPDFVSIPYYQVFEERYGFTENLSIVDLLFNMGNESLLILEKGLKRIP